MFIALFRIVKFSLQDFLRNFWLSVATIIILILTLISINFLLTLNFITKVALDEVRDKIDVSIYFKQDVPESQIGNIKSYLLSMTEVKDVFYVSPEDALEKFKETHKDDPAILESLVEVGNNPLGATLVVKARDTKDYENILKVFDDQKYDAIILEKNFEDHQAVIEKVTEIAEKGEKTALGIAGIFAIVAVLIIFNTVRIAIYTHRDEIGIMKLVGATNWFIRLPYLASGIIYGFLAVIISVIITYPIIGFIEPYMTGLFGGTSLNILSFFTRNYLFIFGGQFLGVVVLTIVVSSLAVGRYLKI